MSQKLCKWVKIRLEVDFVPGDCDFKVKSAIFATDGPIFLGDEAAIS